VLEARKQARCAIYTRKSTEHNLDLEFNSLDAQREACEAYIKSQAHESWRLLPDQFDDGGISGGTLDRPALQRLILEIQGGRIDVVVVYKVDRLTRSLTDFAKLVDLFDRHGVSFVSITQSFNTTTSMGRLTLNVLLSFAQFEREVIGERVRDKIAASKRKGLWMGGSVPLGYTTINKKLVILEEEAETVRTIFQRYLELGSIRALAEDLDKQGVVTKRRIFSENRAVGGIRFGVGPLGYLLKNRIYIGEVVHRNEVHAGDHQPILSREVFDAVQEKLACNDVDRKLRLKSSPSLLTGLLYDDRGNKMSPSHTKKRGVRYRYYVSQALQQKRSGVGNVRRVSGPDIESVVLDALRTSPAVLGAEDDRALIEMHVEKVIVAPGQVEIQLQASADAAAGGSSDAPIFVPSSAVPHLAEKCILGQSESQSSMGTQSQTVLLTAIAKA
jgi:site-specific DNA recombinase